MALVLITLETAIKNAFTVNVPNATAQQTAQINALSLALATAIDTYIKSATVTVPIIPVQVVPASGTGATTLPTIAPIT